MPVDWNSNPEVLDIYKKLIVIYKNNPAISKGTLATFPDDNVLAFEKSDKEGKFLVLVNVRNAKQQFKAIPDEWQDVDVVEMLTDKDYKLEKSIELNPFQYLIFKKK